MITTWVKAICRAYGDVTSPPHKGGTACSEEEAHGRVNVPAMERCRVCAKIGLTEQMLLLLFQLLSQQLLVWQV